MQPRIGIALGSGAARGMAHIGVLKVLEEEGIAIEAIAGTSIGAFIGALYAAGVPVGLMEEVACRVDWRQLALMLDPTLPTSGLIDGRKVARFMEELLPVRTFEELRIPLAVVATDVESGESLVIRKGNLLQALQASIAFPGIFTPVRFGDRFLVDGGLCNPVPADVVRDMGAEKVIGVCAIPEARKRQVETYLPLQIPSEKKKGHIFEFFNVERIEGSLREALHLTGTERKGTSLPERKPPGIFRICSQSVIIMENEINQLRLERNSIDLLIRPDLQGIALLDFHLAAIAIQAGVSATRAQVDRIRALAVDPLKALSPVLL